MNDAVKSGARVQGSRGACSTRKLLPQRLLIPGLCTQYSNALGKKKRHLSADILHISTPSSSLRCRTPADGPGAHRDTQTRKPSTQALFFFALLTSPPPSRPSSLAVGAAPPGPGRTLCGFGRSSSSPTPVWVVWVGYVGVRRGRTTRGR